MKKLVVGAAVAAAVLLPSEEAGAAMTGNELAAACRAAISVLDFGGDVPHRAFEGAKCIGFLDAHVSAELLKQHRGEGDALYCLPPRSNYEQAIRIFVRWADENPNLLHMFGWTVVGLAMAEAFPCD